MPLIYSDLALINLELIKEDNSSLFKLTDSKFDTSISFNYVPKLEEGYDFMDFQLMIFENKYLNAENDVFQVFEKENGNRLGWIFPLSVLESNENDLFDNIHFNKYKFVAYQLLLLANGRSINLDTNFTEFQLSDIYKDNPIILVLSNSNTLKIPDFNIKDYIPSLSKFGYYEQNENSYKAKLKPKDEFCIQFRGKEKITLFKSKTKVYNDRFFSELFDKHLKFLDHHLIRFHLLYQIIEYILTERFDTVFNKLVNDYNTSELMKNDFIEQINQLGKERVNIKKIVECVKQNPHDFDTVNLERDCKALLENHNNKIKNSLGDMIYDTRNLIMHNYRNIESEEIELIENITHELELLTINIIEHYCPQQCL